MSEDEIAQALRVRTLLGPLADSLVGEPSTDELLAAMRELPDEALVRAELGEAIVAYVQATTVRKLAAMERLRAPERIKMASLN